MRDAFHGNSDSLLPLLRQTFDGIALLTPQPWRLAFANPALAAWLGRPPGDLRGQLLEEILEAAPSGELLRQIDRVWQGAASDAAVMVYLRTDTARVAAMEARLCRVVVDDESVIGISLRKAPASSPSLIPGPERRDPLTELPDRAFLETRLTALLHGERCADRHFAVLFVDLDNFKQVNDGHGHVMGDRVLRECAQRLAECVRDGDHVTRFGGDEFVVLLEQVTGRDEIDPVIERINLALAKPIALPGGSFTLRVSIGVAEASPQHQSPEDLLQDADRAMYAAKRVRM